MALKSRDDGGTDYYRMANGKIDGKPFSSVTLEDSLTTNPAGFTADDKTLYWIDSRGRNTAALIAQDVATGTKTVFAESPKVDISGTWPTRKTLQVEAYLAEYLTPERSRSTRTSARPSTGRVQARRARRSSRRGPTRRQVDRQGRPMASRRRFICSIGRRQPVPGFTRAVPSWSARRWSQMWPVEIKSRDGLTLPSYLTLPGGRRRRTATAGPTIRCRWCCSSTAGRGAATPMASTPTTSGSPTAAMRCSRSTYRGLDRLRQGFVTAGNLAVGPRRCTTT